MRKIVLFLIIASIICSSVIAQTVTVKKNEVPQAVQQNTDVSLDDIERLIEELQAKRLEALLAQRKALEEQKTEQEKKQKELSEKEEALKKEQEKKQKELSEKEQEKNNSDTNVKPEPVIGRVVYVEAPNIIQSNDDAKAKTLTGTNAVKKSVENSTVLPSFQDDGGNKLEAFVYKEQSLYQIHCQTYHTTMIQLEPGEQLLEVPYISETEVWKLSRGTGLTDGKAVQYLMLKPDKSNLDSTMIIITDRRVYQMQIKSFSDHYMPYVKWVYNDSYKNDWNVRSAANIIEEKNTQNDRSKPSAIEDILGNVADTYSFNYEIRTTAKTQPSWYPVAVYDNGQSTFIILPKNTLNMEMPSVFENTKDIINKNVKKNVIVINKLVKKLTLKLGNEKVTIKKL